MIDVPDFDAVYRADADPWRVRSSYYERRKLEIVLACLTAPAYASAWDPACGVGELAARLAGRANRVLATDSSTEAVRLSTERCADLSNVQVQVSALPHPPGRTGFDLVVLSEFLYYLSEADRAATLVLVDAATAPIAEVVALHWRHQPHDGHLSGDRMQAEIDAALTARGWQPVVQHGDEDFSLTCFRRSNP